MKPTYRRTSGDHRRTKQWKSLSGTSMRGKSTTTKRLWPQLKNNYSVQLLCGEAVSGDDVQILREVAGAVAHVERQQTARWQRINKEQIKTKKSSEATPPTTSPSSQTDKSRQEKEHEKKKEERKKEKDGDKVERHSNSKAEYRGSPKKGTEPAVDLLGLDAPEGGGKGSGGAAPIGDELDIFGPMVSNPLPSSNNTQQAQSGSSIASPQVDPSTSSSSSSSTSTTTTAKAEEKKLLSKDSILSLYASSSVGSQPQSQQQPAPGQGGVYMGQPQMQFTPQGYATAVAGSIPPTTTMMGGGAVVSGMALPNGGYMSMQQGAMPANQGQNMYSMQQGQWNMGQMTQQMSGMALSGGGPAPAASSQSGAPGAGWPAVPSPASGQTLSTQLWK
ncbi:stromal membrane-associated protein 1 isoform X5 [Oreochromis niloticus]|uniref:stromal membrane-associated protein 1 isoform X5 n=1 Tax=Oreochromis niloticus TaxID=8128 RepID=UPI0006748DD5|nr:stromal membrane-associated protein 1 isoform X5 [Oreochromis niloticus]